MAYRGKTIWTNNDTPVNADNLNNLEEGVEEAVENSEVDAAVIALYETLGWTPPNA